MAVCFSRFFSAVVLIFCMGLATAPVLGQCPSDAYEPNNDRSAAKLLAAGGYEDLHSEKGDEDWYYLNVLDRDYLTITATFTHSQGDIDLYLYDASGNEPALVTGNSSSDNETVTWPVEGDGVVMIRVEMYTPDGCNGYSLDIDISPNYCEEDIYEENDDLASATPVGVGTINNLVSGDGDEDWFAIDVLPGDELTVSAFHEYAAGNIDLYLYDDTGKEKAQSISTDDDEVMTWLSDFEGTVYAKVIMVTPDGCNGYSLDVAIVEPCVEDAYDLNGGNDDKNSATPVSAGEYPDLVSAWGNEDWFELQVQPGDALLVAANFDTADGNIDIFLMSSDGTEMQVTGGDSITDNELITWTSTLDETVTVYIRVVMTSEDGCNGYALNIGSEDDYEENDTLQTAPTVVPETYPELVVASGDDDWYAITVCSGSTVTLTATFTHLLGDIDLYLYDGSSNELGSSASADDDEEIVWESTLDGTVYLRVINYSPDTFNRYALNVQLSSDCQPPVATITSPVGCSYLQGSVSVEGEVSDGQLAGWTLEYTRGDANNWIPIASGTEGVDGVLAEWDTSELDPCAYILRLVATDDDKNRTEYYISVNAGYLADLDRDGKVDLNDLAKMAGEWLLGN